jgi:riboflavin biosynthesis pyrimidine reductase
MREYREERFARFVAEKTATATAAAIAPLATAFDHGPQGLTSIENAWSTALFGGPFYTSPPPKPGRPSCGLVFVQSLDGNTGAADPSTLGGGEMDKHLIYEGLSQVTADAVLSGAGTIGTTNVFAVWHPELVRLRAALGKPRYPMQVVATRQGLDLEQHLIFNVPGVTVIVVTTAAGLDRMQRGLEARPWVQPLVLPPGERFADAFRALAARGIRRICAVGGRHVATQLIDEGLVQDVYLTTAARPGGQPGTPFYPHPLKASVLLHKDGTGPDAGVTFEHLLPTP